MVSRKVCQNTHHVKRRDRRPTTATLRYSPVILKTASWGYSESRKGTVKETWTSSVQLFILKKEVLCFFSRMHSFLSSDITPILSYGGKSICNGDLRSVVKADGLELTWRPSLCDIYLTISDHKHYFTWVHVPENILHTSLKFRTAVWTVIKGYPEDLCAVCVKRPCESSSRWSKSTLTAFYRLNYHHLLTSRAPYDTHTHALIHAYPYTDIFL